MLDLPTLTHARESHAWQSKILISRVCANFSRLTDKCEFLAHRPIKCKFSTQFVKMAGTIGSRRVIFGNARKPSVIFGNVQKSSDIFGNWGNVGIENLMHLTLESWQVYHAM